MSESQKIILKDPTGRSVTYGAYDNIMVNTTEGKTLYSKLPPVNSQNNSEVLSVVDGIWSKRKLDQPDWQIANKQAEGYIKNRPFYEEIVDEIWKVTESSTVYITQEGTPIGVQLSTHTPKAEEMLLATIKVTVPSVGYEDVSISLSSESLLEGKDYSFFGEIGLGVFYKSGKISITDQGITEVVNVPSAGIYYLFGQSLEEAQGLEFKVKFVQKENLDNKYLSIWNGGLEKFGNFIDTSRAQKEWNEQFGKYVWTLSPLERSAVRTDITEAWKKGTKLNIRATMLGQVKEYICYPYEVEYNGQKYKAYGESSWLGSQGDGEPFLIAGTLPSDDEPFVCMVFDLISGQQENRITHIECDVLIEQELKIDEKYLPENFGKGGASEWSELQNKPFSEQNILKPVLAPMYIKAGQADENGLIEDGIYSNNTLFDVSTFQYDFEHLNLALEADRVYQIEFDDKVYLCKAYTNPNTEFLQVALIGNRSDTETGWPVDQTLYEPFLIVTLVGTGISTLCVTSLEQAIIPHRLAIYERVQKSQINSINLPRENGENDMLWCVGEKTYTASADQQNVYFSEFTITLEQLLNRLTREKFDNCEIIINEKKYRMPLNTIEGYGLNGYLYAGVSLNQALEAMNFGSISVQDDFEVGLLGAYNVSETTNSYQFMIIVKDKTLTAEEIALNTQIKFSQDSVEPLPEKYLSKATWNNLIDKPFGHFTRKKIGTPTIIDLDSPAFLISEIFNFTPSWGQYEYEINGDTYRPLNIITQENGITFIYLTTDGTKALISTGLVCMISGFDQSSSTIVLNIYMSEHDQKIDPKWLPYGADAILPSVTVQDKGKFLCVNDSGLWEATAILNVSEVGL